LVGGHVDLESTDNTLTDRERAELAALVDDALPARRRAAVEASVGASPALEALVGEQRRTRDAVRAAALETSAPIALRARVQDARRAGAPRARRRKLALGGAVATVAAAGALVLVLTLPGNIPGGPTIVEASELAARPANAPAPGRDTAQPKLLATQVEGVSYPYWDDIRWEATGSRVDSLHGRRVTTVFYDRAGKRVGYQIIPGARVAPPVAVHQETIGGTVFRLFNAGHRRIVTWVRADHTCVLSSTTASRAVLIKLASWKGGGGVPF
jgi:hypothetical protein